jgi:arylformamidase
MQRLIDLSHTLVPGEAGRKFEIEMVGADQVNPNVIRLENQWYIMHEISMVSHIGTHIEAPYHILKNGPDLAQLSLETLCGPAVVLNLRGLTPNSAITVEHVQAAAGKAGGVQPGDIVLCDLGYADSYGTDRYAEAPYFTTAAIEWLADSGMKMMGVDATGVEVPESETHVNHHALFERGIPVIENVAHFNELRASRVQLYAFPIGVSGLESFPLRVVAVEEIGSAD